MKLQIQYDGEVIARTDLTGLRGLAPDELRQELLGHLDTTAGLGTVTWYGGGGVNSDKDPGILVFNLDLFGSEEAVDAISGAIGNVALGLAPDREC